MHIPIGKVDRNQKLIYCAPIPARKDARKCFPDLCQRKFHVPEKSLAIEQILTLLAEHPRRIAAATAALTPARLHTPPNPGEWSANEVLAHLRSCADVWGNCMAMIIARDMPTIRAVNPRTWIHGTDYLEQEFQLSFQAFAAQRTDLLDFLKSLAPEAWSRAATVTGAGKPLARTVHSYAQWLATHERPHVKQIERIAKVV